jgi:hypothetical protein
MLLKSPGSYYSQPLFVRSFVWEVSYQAFRASVPLPNSRCCNQSRHTANAFNTGSAQKETRIFTRVCGGSVGISENPRCAAESTTIFVY